MSIHEKGLLARLSISQWSARKFDRQVSSDVNKIYHAKEDTSRVNKLLVPKEMIAPVEAATMRARSFFEFNTSPWLDDGVRILASARYFEFMPQLEALKLDWEDHVNTFVEKYDDYLKFSAPRFMGQLYKNSDYPHPEDVRNRFSFTVRFMPVPHQDDWRVETTSDVEAKLKAELIEQLNDAERAIYADIAGRVLDKVGHIRKRLLADEQFRRNSFEAVEVLAEVIPALNVVDDMRITNLIADLKVLASADLKAVRKDDNYRNQVIEQTDAILKKMETIYGTPRETAESEDELGSRSAVLRLTGT